MNSIAELVKQVQELTELSAAQVRTMEEKDAEISRLKAACDAQGELTQKYQALALEAAQAAPQPAGTVDFDKMLFDFDMARISRKSVLDSIRAYGRQCRDAALEEAAKLIEQVQALSDEQDEMPPIGDLLHRIDAMVSSMTPEQLKEHEITVHESPDGRRSIGFHAVAEPPPSVGLEELLDYLAAHHQQEG